jgi:hypothetical protein
VGSNIHSGTRGRPRAYSLGVTRPYLLTHRDAHTQIMNPMHLGNSITLIAVGWVDVWLSRRQPNS